MRGGHPCPSSRSFPGKTWSARGSAADPVPRARARPVTARTARKKGVESLRTAAASCHHHFAEHARLHVVEQVAVISPAPERVGGHEIGEALRRLHSHRVFAYQKLAGRIDE